MGRMELVALRQESKFEIDGDSRIARSSRQSGKVKPSRVGYHVARP
jgi:hypothetical protein